MTTKPFNLSCFIVKLHRLLLRNWPSPGRAKWRHSACLPSAVAARKNEGRSEREREGGREGGSSWATTRRVAPTTTRSMTRKPLLEAKKSSKIEVLALKHESKIFSQSSNLVCGFSMMEQVRLCAVWPTQNFIGSSMSHMQVGGLSEDLTLVL